jgi:hypothetical protein
MFDHLYAELPEVYAGQREELKGLTHKGSSHEGSGNG